MKNVLISFAVLLLSSSLTAKTVEQLAEEVSKLNTDKTCETSEDCVVAPIGIRACGGPEYYEIYSKKSASGEKLPALIKQLNRAHSKRYRSSGMASICVVATKPKVACVGGQCKNGVTP